MKPYYLRKNFFSSLNMENIISVDYTHAKWAFKNFNNKNIGDYHDLYVRSDTLLLVDVFKNFRNKCIETYELDSANFLSAPELAWQACLKNELEAEYVMQYIDMQKQTINTWNIVIKKKIRHILCI